MKGIVPDYMSALVGYRAWDVSPSGTLMSLNQNTSEPWPEKYRKQAICTAVREHGWSGGVGRYMAATTSRSVVAPMPTVRDFADVWLRRKAERKARNHHAPMPDCQCGIYAAKSDRSDHFSLYVHQATVWGEVYLWGKIQEYTDGYRAEFAYPKSLSTTNAQLAPKIAERYGVPCAAVTSDDNVAVKLYGRESSTSSTALFTSVAQVLTNLFVSNSPDC